MTMARRMFEDCISHRVMETCGCMQDGSNKSFWPNGFVEYVYAETLMNRGMDYEAELEGYYKALYGDQWEQVVSYLKKMSEAFNFAYMEGEKSSNPAYGPHYNPAQAASLDMVKELSAWMRNLCGKRKPGKVRVQGLAWRLLLRHAEYCEGLAEAMLAKCKGHDRLAVELYDQFVRSFGRHEYEIERYVDYGLAVRANRNIISKMPKIEQ